MTMTAPEILVTPEDLLNMPNEIDYELVHGKLVERHMGMKASRITSRIGGLLDAFLQEHPLGLLFNAEAGYQCFGEDRRNVRKPDVSFVGLGRFPGDEVPDGYSTIPPDLAMEVVSPRDLAYEFEEKVAEYLRGGVKLIWIVTPNTRTVRIHRPRSSPRGSVSELTADDSLSGEDVLPGFECPVSQFFT